MQALLAFDTDQVNEVVAAYTKLARRKAQLLAERKDILKRLQVHPSLALVHICISTIAVRPVSTAHQSAALVMVADLSHLCEHFDPLKPGPLSR